MSTVLVPDTLVSDALSVLLGAALLVLVCLQHTSYHRTIGLAGAILVVSRVTARCLVTHPALAPGLEAGWYRIIIWVSAGGGLEGWGGGGSQGERGRGAAGKTEGCNGVNVGRKACQWSNQRWVVEEGPVAHTGGPHSPYTLHDSHWPEGLSRV